MGSIYKRERKRRDGRRTEDAFYTLSYRDERGKPRTAKGYTDKRASAEKLRKIEERVARIREGLPVAPAEGQLRTYDEAAKLFVAELARQGRSAAYVKTVAQQLRLVAEWEQKKGGDQGEKKRWLHLRDVRADELTVFLTYLATRTPAAPKKGRRGVNRQADQLGPASPRTCNAYRDTLSAFCTWCCEQDWMDRNPCDRVPKSSLGRPGDTSKRPRARRALTVFEFGALTACPKVRDWRRTLYTVAGLSGLRRLELKQLAPCDFTLGDRPRWHLRPEITKGKRLDVVPMLPECATLMKALAAGRSPADLIFPQCPGHKTIERDLARAGVPRRDHRGRVANGHSLRYFFCTLVGRTLPIQRVRQLMRHADIRTTCNLYLDLGIEDVADQLAALPALLEDAKRAAPGAAAG